MSKASPLRYLEIYIEYTWKYTQRCIECILCFCITRNRIRLKYSFVSKFVFPEAVNSLSAFPSRVKTYFKYFISFSCRIVWRRRGLAFKLSAAHFKFDYSYCFTLNEFIILYVYSNTLSIHIIYCNNGPALLVMV